MLYLEVEDGYEDARRESIVVTTVYYAVQRTRERLAKRHGREGAPKKRKR